MKPPVVFLPLLLNPWLRLHTPRIHLLSHTPPWHPSSLPSTPLPSLRHWQTPGGPSISGPPGRGRGWHRWAQPQPSACPRCTGHHFGCRSWRAGSWCRRSWGQSWRWARWWWRTGRAPRPAARMPTGSGRRGRAGSPCTRPRTARWWPPTRWSRYSRRTYSTWAHRGGRTAPGHWRTRRWCTPRRSRTPWAAPGRWPCSPPPRPAAPCWCSPPSRRRWWPGRRRRWTRCGGCASRCS